jgi:NADH-quinone oxidoreductase subunit N
MSFLDLVILLPELFFINFLLIFLWVGLYLRSKFFSNLFFSAFCYYASLLLFITVLLLCNATIQEASALLNIFVFSEFEISLKIFTLIISLCVILSIKETDKYLSLNNLDIEINVLRLIIVSAMLLLISVNDLVYLFFILELYSLSAYILVGYRAKRSIFSAEGAIKYFILGTVFSIIMCYSFAIVYLVTGLTNLTSLQSYLSVSLITAFDWNGYDLLTPAILLILISFFFKLAAAPFAFWAPDVYEGAPTSSMYFLAVIPKIAILGIVVKLSFLWVSTTLLINIIIISAALSFIIGSLGGLFQNRIKRLLTYSMINNNGFFLLGLIAGTTYGLTFMFFFLIIYTLLLLGLFTSLNSLRLFASLRTLKNFWSWVNLFFVNKTQALILALLLFSSAGVPPLVGFLAKFFILFSTISSFSSLTYLLIFALILSPLSAFYYLRLIKVMSFSRKRIWLFLKPPSALASFLISAVTVLLFILFLSSGLILNFTLLLII